MKPWCLRFNRASISPAIRHAFRLISRLGDGIFWYCLMVWLLVGISRRRAVAGVAHGCCRTGLYRAVQMAEAQDAPAAPVLQESAHQLRHRAAGPVQLPFRPHAACGRVQHRGAGLTIRRLPGCCCRLPRWWPFPGWCSGCITPATCWPGTAIGAVISGLSLSF